MVFSGTELLAIRVRLLFVATGMNTEFGKIAEAIKGC